MLAAVIIVSLLQSQVFSVMTVNQSSMENTLTEGQKLLMEKVTYSCGVPERGDIVVFLREGETGGFWTRLRTFFLDVSLRIQGDYRRDRLIKRVIAIGGDEIEIQDGVVRINGILLDEPYAKTTASGNSPPRIVPDGFVFVLGDNRAVSIDSRQFGMVQTSRIEGRIIFVLTPLEKMGSLDIHE